MLPWFSSNNSRDIINGNIANKGNENNRNLYNNRNDNYNNNSRNDDRSIAIVFTEIVAVVRTTTV